MDRVRNRDATRGKGRNSVTKIVGNITRKLGNTATGRGGKERGGHPRRPKERAPHQD